MDFNPRTTIAELKVEIAKLLNLSVEVLSLRVNDKILMNDSHSLASCSISVKSTVVVFIKQRGGSSESEEDEKYSIGGLKYRAYVASLSASPTFHVYTPDSGGSTQIRALTEEEQSRDIGNAATKDSGSNIGLGADTAVVNVTFENTVLQIGDSSSCTPISNMLRGRSAKGPPEDALVEKIVQQVQYETESIDKPALYLDSETLRALSVADNEMMGTYSLLLSMDDMQVQDTAVRKGLQYATSRMTFENTVLQIGDSSSCTPISNMLRGRSAKGPPDDASVEKIVQQVQYETVIDRISWIRHFTLFLMIMYIFLESFCSTGMVGVVRARPLTAVELYLSCACANTDDSASNPLPSIPSGLEKEQLDKAIEGEFSKLIKVGEVTIWK